MKHLDYLLCSAMLGLVLLTGKAFAQSVYTPYTFTTLAGYPNFNSSPIGTNVDGAGSEARFWSPSGVAVDSAGNIYVADSGNHTVRKVTRAGLVTTLAGVADHLQDAADGIGNSARFGEPTSVALDSAGNVYVADFWDNAIRKVTPTGVVTTLAGGGKSGNADGTGRDARFDQPFAVAVDNSGILYVADSGNNSLRKVSPAGVVTTLAGGTYGSANGAGLAAQFNYPSGIAVDASGNAFVADTRSHTIRRVTPDGIVTTLAGMAYASGSADGTGSNARFNSPLGLATDHSGNVYVADFHNNTIRRVTPAGVVTTLAGLGGSEGMAEGTASAAQFRNPSGVAVDGDGNVYVADTFNQIIRKGVFATVVLESGPRFHSNGGQFKFTLVRPMIQSIVVEASTDLVNWFPIATNAVRGSLSFTDLQSSFYARRFYRTISP